MAIQNARDLFLATLSHLHRSEQRLLGIVEEMIQQTQETDVRQLLEVRAHFTRQAVSNIEECFRLLGEQPMAPQSRFFEVVAEDMRRELNEIQAPALRTLYVLGAIRRVQDFHIGEYNLLLTMAGLMGNVPVAALLKHNLDDKIDFVERTREYIREIVRTAIAGRLPAAA